VEVKSTLIQSLTIFFWFRCSVLIVLGIIVIEQSCKVEVKSTLYRFV